MDFEVCLMSYHVTKVFRRQDLIDSKKEVLPCAWQLGIPEGPAAPIDEIKTEMERRVSQQRLGGVECTVIDVYLPIFVSQCRIRYVLSVHSTTIDHGVVNRRHRTERLNFG
jgi:hypothetical protein